MNTKASLWFKSGLDNTTLRRDTKEASDLISNMRSKAILDSKKMEDGFSGIGKTLALVGGTAAIGMLGKSILETTAKFEKFGIVLRNTLGDARGNASLDMIAQFAATTPFQLDEVTAAFIKMANQGFVPTKEELVKLGDLASSTGKSFDQLTEALLDAQTGQFERLKEFGIKASAQGDKVTFSFKEQLTTVDNTNSAIQKYILSLGELKGVSGANALISQSLTGQISNLEDKLAAMFNEIGSANKGVLYDTVEITSTLIENYDVVGKLLIGLVATYGAYKAALIVAASASKGYTLAESLQYGALLMTEKAQVALNRSMLLNPYVAATMAVVALVAGIYALATATSDAQEAHNKLQETVDDTNKSIASEQIQIDTLFARLKAAKKGTEEYQSAKDAIYSKYGSYLEKLGDENTALNDVALAYETISVAAEKAAKARGLEAATKQAADDLVNKQAEINKELKELLDDTYGKDSKKTLETFYQLKKVVDSGKGTDSVSKDLLSQFDVKESLGYRSDGTEMFYVSNELKSLIENGKEAKRIFNDINKQAVMMFGNAPASSTNNEGDKKTEGGIDYIFRNGKWVVVQVQETPAQKKKREAAEKKAADEALKLKQENDKKLEDYEKSKLEAKENLHDEEIELIRTKTEDKKKLIEIDYQEQLKLIKDEEDAYKKVAEAAGDKNPDLSVFNTRRDVALKQKNQNIIQVDKEEKEALLEKYKSFTDKKLEIDKKYEEDVAKLKELGANLVVGTKEYEENKRAIQEANRVKIKATQDLSNEVYDSLKKENENFKKLFGDSTKYTNKELKEVIGTGKKIKEFLETGDMNIASSLQLTPEQVVAIRENKDNILKTLQEIIDKQEELYDSSGTIAKVGQDFGKLKTAIADGDKKGIQSSLIKIVEGVGKVSSAFGELSGQVREFAELTGRDELEDVATNLENMFTTVNAAVSGFQKGFELGGIYGGIAGAVIGGGMDILLRNARQKKEIKEANEEIAKSVAAIAREYEILEFQQRASGEQFETIFGTDTYSQALNSLRAYNEALALSNGGQYSGRSGNVSSGNLTNTLNSISVQTRAEDRRLLRRDIEAEYATILELYRTLIDESGQLNAEVAASVIANETRLTQSQKDSLQKLVDYANESATALESYTSYIENIFGELSNNISDALVDAFRNGTDAAEVMTDSVSEMFEKMFIDMLNAQLITPIINQYSAEFSESLSSGTEEDSMAIMEEMIQEMNLAANDYYNGLEMYQTAAERYGFDLFSNTAERATRNTGIATASQDTVDELNGRFTVIQSHTYSINETIRALQANSNAILLNVQGIKTNTDELPEMKESLSSIKTAITSINDRGITLR